MIFHSQFPFSVHTINFFKISGGYPNNPGPYPAKPGGLSAQDCVRLVGFDEVMCFAFRTDNSGPPENVQVMEC